MSDSPRSAGLSSQRPIPAVVRKFGQALDPSALEPGDLILVAHRQPNWKSRQICSYQAKMFPEEHARWYHAAVSGGGYEICEATARGVKACEYWEYMTGKYDLKIRRLKGADAATRSRLAYYAATYVNTKYGFWNILNVARTLTSGNDWNRPAIVSKGIICSQLYFEAAMRVGYLLARVRPEAVCPAQLSISEIMDDVTVPWVQV